MGRFIDLTGQTFGRLKVLQRTDNAKDGSARWICECNCGNSMKIAEQNGFINEIQKD